MSLADLSKGVFSAAEALSDRLEQPLRPNDLIELANQAIQLSGKVWEEIKKRPITDIDEIACKNGCSWCCYKQVEVSPLEVFGTTHLSYFFETATGILSGIIIGMIYFTDIKDKFKIQ